jgi:hypothetical protein
MDELQQLMFVGAQLLCRLTYDTRHKSPNEPCREADFQNHDKRAILFEGSERSAQIVLQRHGALRSINSAERCHTAAPPHSISPREVLAGLTPASIRRLHTAVVTQFPS